MQANNIAPPVTILNSSRSVICGADIAYGCRGEFMTYGHQIEPRLRLLGVGTSTNKFPAAGATGAIFLCDGLGQIDSGHIGNGGQPSQNVSKFGLSLFVTATAQ